MPFPIPLAVGLAGLAGSAISAWGQRRTNQANVDNAIQQQQMAQNWNLEQWHRQNQYNTPKAQMERFKQAGLNPNLIYGQGSPGNAAQVAPAKSGYAERKNDLLSFQNLGGLAASAAQASNIEKQGQLLEAQALNQASQAAYTNEQKKFVGEKAVAEIDKIGAEADNLRMQEKLNEARRSGQELENQIQKQIGKSRIDKWKEDARRAKFMATTAEKQAAIDALKLEVIQTLEKAGRSFLADPIKIGNMIYGFMYEQGYKLFN